MLKIRTENKPSSDLSSNLALFNLAFRPLFLSGSFLAFIFIGFWVCFWSLQFQWQPYGNPIWWHAHELIFGFGAAIIAGFLLTAVQSWTGVKGISGFPLLLLFYSWFIPRFLLFVDSDFPPALIIIADMIFLPAAALVLAYPIVKVKQKRNVVLPIVLMIFASLNALSHYAVLSHNNELSLHTFYAAIFIINLFVSIIGGRVIPFFTANPTGFQRKPAIFIVDALSIASVASLVLIALIGLESIKKEIILAVSLIGFIAHSIRLSRWGFQATFKMPILWSLHLSYAFIPLGMAMLFLWSLGIYQNLSASIHIFTIGSMSGMILAMISRVSLGHTGRPLVVPKKMAFAFLAIALAALVRSLGVILFPTYFILLIEIAGLLWCFSFLLFIFYYAPLLCKPRVDGKPG